MPTRSWIGDCRRLLLRQAQCSKRRELRNAELDQLECGPSI
jgi:hypothetical protein